MTRISSIIASIILRKLSACASARLGKMHMIELADAVHQRPDLAAKLFLELVNRRLGVFNNVVQDGGGNRLRIDVHVRENLCDGNRDGICMVRRTYGSGRGARSRRTRRHA